MSDANDLAETWERSNYKFETLLSNVQNARVFFYAFRLANGKKYPAPSVKSVGDESHLLWRNYKASDGSGTTISMIFRAPEAPVIRFWTPEEVGDTPDLGRLEELLNEHILD